MNLVRFVTAALLSLMPVLTAQSLVPAAEDMRRNLAEASKTSRLESEGTSPFRLEVAFETFDYQGKPDGSGTMVEEWLKPGTQRRVLTYRGSTWTQTSRAGVVRLTGNSFPASYMEDKLIHALLDPGPTEDRLRSVTPNYKPLTIGTVALDCVILAPVDVVRKTDTPDNVPSSYCMSDSPRVVRAVQERYSVDILYSHFLSLDQHFIAKDVAITQGLVQRGTAHVTSLTLAPGLKDADFVLPVGSDSSAEELRLMAGSLMDKDAMVNKVTPRYPEDARQARIQGTVTMDAVVDEAGMVQRLEVISTPFDSMARESIAAVKQWQYKPYLVDGKPTAFRLVLSVNFSFSR